MTAYFTLTLDTAPPANPLLSINGGAPFTGQQDVLVEVDTSDYQGGARDVTDMLLWGDVDPSADPSVQLTEGTSLWQPYQQLTAVKLSSGNGVKTIFGRLKDDVCNTTLEFCSHITFDSTLPYVTITSTVSNSRISKVSGFDTATFSWEASVGFTSYQVRVVPSIGSPHTSGVPLGATHGSIGVTGSGSFLAATPIVTSVKGADLQDASPGDSGKVIKVFVQIASGQWSV